MLEAEVERFRKTAIIEESVRDGIKVRSLRKKCPLVTEK
jgi:hypothetical protein